PCAFAVTDQNDLLHLSLDSRSFNDADTRESSCSTQLLFDSEELIVFANAIGPARRSGLDLAGGGADCQGGDRRVFRLSGSVRNYGGVLCVCRHPNSLQRLGDGANLVELDEESVADAVTDPAFENLGVRHEYVVADELNAAAKLSRQHLPAFPITLRNAVFN